MIHERCPTCGCPRFPHTIHRCPPLLRGGRGGEIEPADGSLFWLLMLAIVLVVAAILLS